MPPAATARTTRRESSAIAARRAARRRRRRAVERARASSSLARPPACCETPPPASVKPASRSALASSGRPRSIAARVAARSAPKSTRAARAVEADVDRHRPGLGRVEVKLGLLHAVLGEQADLDAERGREVGRIDRGRERERRRRARRGRRVGAVRRRADAERCGQRIDGDGRARSCAAGESSRDAGRRRASWKRASAATRRRSSRASLDRRRAPVVRRIASCDVARVAARRSGPRCRARAEASRSPAVDSSRRRSRRRRVARGAAARRRRSRGRGRASRRSAGATVDAARSLRSPSTPSRRRRRRTPRRASSLACSESSPDAFAVVAFGVAARALAAFAGAAFASIADVSPAVAAVGAGVGVRRRAPARALPAAGASPRLRRSNSAKRFAAGVRAGRRRLVGRRRRRRDDRRADERRCDAASRAPGRRSRCSQEARRAGRGEAVPRRAHGAVVAFLLLVASVVGLALAQAPLDQLLAGSPARISCAAHDRLGALDLHRGVRGDALLLLDRLRQALDEALVAADELDLAFAAELARSSAARTRAGRRRAARPAPRRRASRSRP